STSAARRCATSGAGGWGASATMPPPAAVPTGTTSGSEGLTIHGGAAKGYERNAGAYERGRPDYPAEAVAILARRIGIGPGSTVVDLAAGTGKFTRCLLPIGARVFAVEPVEA